MAWTQADLDKINRAIASGAESIRFQDKAITYHSLENLRAIRNEIERSLSTRPRRSRVRYVCSDKGL